VQEGVVPAGDGSPAQDLRSGRRGERFAKPGAGGFGEGCEGIGPGHETVSLARRVEEEHLFYTKRDRGQL
jgi:hypothetical protein